MDLQRFADEFLDKLVTFIESNKEQLFAEAKKDGKVFSFSWRDQHLPCSFEISPKEGQNDSYSITIHLQNIRTNSNYLSSQTVGKEASR